MIRYLALAVLGALALCPAGARADGAAYCVRKGGTVQTRQPFYGTNGGTTALQLAGAAKFCQFVSKKDGSQIDVLLATLDTAQPTLAALAYYAEEKAHLKSCKGSPGSCYCTQLGGTDLFGGITAAGGGWVLTTDSTDVLDACVFPDLSIIDSYGLFYHSAGIVRGKDLSRALKYKSPYAAATNRP